MTFADALKAVDSLPLQEQETLFGVLRRKLAGVKSARAQESLPAELADPEEVFELLRQLIADGQVRTAREVLAEAGRRFPGHARIELAQRVLAEGNATPHSFAQPTAAAEIEWLREPPQEYRGKWVALVGNEVVDVADSAAELMDSLESKNLAELPVVQYLAP